MEVTMVAPSPAKTCWALRIPRSNERRTAVLASTTLPTGPNAPSAITINCNSALLYRTSSFISGGYQTGLYKYGYDINRTILEIIV